MSYLRIGFGLALLLLGEVTKAQIQRDDHLHIVPSSLAINSFVDQLVKYSRSAERDPFVGAHLNSEYDTLDFGTINSCAPATKTTAIRNDGDEELQIESLTLPANSSFTIKTSALGQWLEPEEEVQIEVGALTDKPGTFAQDLEMKAKSAGGASLTLRVALLSTVELPAKDHSISQVGVVQGLTTCNMIDTSVTITNLSTCEDMKITNVVVSHPAVSLLDAATERVLKPGESTSYRLRLDGAGQTAIADIVQFTTDLFGVITSDVSASVRTPKLTYLSVTEPTETYTTSQCSTVTLPYSFSTSGCGYLPVTDVKLEPMTGTSTKFTVKLVNATLPKDIIEGEQINFEVTYDPELTGDDAAFIVILGDEGQERYRIPIAGVVEQVKTSLGLAMSIDQIAPLTMSERLTVTIMASDAVAASAALSMMQTELHYDRDLFSLESTTSMAGVTLQHSPTATGESLTLTSSAFSFAKDDVLATLTLKPFVTEHTSSEISLQGLVLNDNDADYARCIMSPSSTLSTSIASVVLDCVERELQRSMDGTRSIMIRSIYPQPADDQSAVTLELSALLDETVDLVITDALGRLVHRESRHVMSGISSFTLPALRAGYHNVQLRGASTMITRSLIVR